MIETGLRTDDDAWAIVYPDDETAGEGWRDEASAPAGGVAFAFGDDGDFWFGGEGDDRVEALGGDDDLDGKGGKDRIYAGDGDDYVYGGTGHDRLRGDAGDDFLVGDEGWGDRAGGRDRISGGSGDDWIEGEGGNDKLRGGSGDDYIAGGTGRDKIYGGSGADEIDGGEDADRIDGGRGDDILRGNSGGDRFVFKGSSGDDVIQDFALGEDRLKLRVDGAVSLSAAQTDDGDAATLVSWHGGSVLLEHVTVASLDALF